MPPWLTDPEIADLCDGLQQPAAMVRYLRSLGLTVNIKPNGRPLVVRSHAEAVLAGRTEAPPAADRAQGELKPQPNRAALLQLIGGRHGSQTKVQPA